ncbi:PQQ-dependent sugar dehydrogenase [Jeongeupia naejangsanensis]|uniref:PQQ-dependent sugar dehydrogenase n=1 Tax=Jeongeupia naejangsanensis TaxID=613195 RepID=A0ABS2BFD8_9NEIS|nr:PQQ-dependent sugar dehydrogenase [Jeongeupia naejangsanensis]MBM3114324.1 PQQ-dependent sugar dehydrogenase [Jeongeupia naejangsanensis]
MFISPSRAAVPVSINDNWVTTTVAQGLAHPWGLAFLPDGRMLVTERPGRLRIVSPGGALSAPVPGVPDVFASGQGGLLDVALDPKFATNRRVYLSYAEADSNGRAGTAVARAELVETGGKPGLTALQVIFRQQPKVEGGAHFGSRLVFARDGTLFVTLGERYQRDRAQDLGTHLGKVVRINTDGSIPAGNPFSGRQGARPEIWSYGHRNPQGAAINPASGRLWTVEHGARGGDEINIPLAGANYGWPVITYGRDYTGFKIGEGTAKAGMQQPVYYWDPSIAPSGMAFYAGDRYPGWRGSLFVGALKDTMLVRLTLSGEQVVAEERLLQQEKRRIRDVRQGPDGWLYLLTDEDDGQILRLQPKR